MLCKVQSSGARSGTSWSKRRGGYLPTKYRKIGAVTVDVTNNPEKRAGGLNVGSNFVTQCMVGVAFYPHIVGGIHIGDIIWKHRDSSTSSPRNR